jgi:hypothetical protein
MKKDCEKFAKLQSSSVFMALAAKYTGKEVQCLNALLATTNRTGCKWCLQRDCNGEDCGAETEEMISAKEKYFNDGAYEYCLDNKLDRESNVHGHSPFTRDSYLSTFQSEVPSGADNEYDPEVQDDVCIMFKASPLLDEAEAGQLQEEVGDNFDHEEDNSDDSSVDEDAQVPDDSGN